MPRSEFRFNKKTLRYERVRFSIWRLLGSFIAYAGFGILFFAGLNLLQNLVIETDEESALKEENEKLITYQASIASQLAESKNILRALKEQEANLYQELFEAPQEKQSISSETMPSNAEMGDQISYLQQLSEKVKEKASNQNHLFATYIDIQKEDVSKLFNLPSAHPIQGITPDNLISGFGIRINPFHKGKYQHDGIDLGFTKGTEVLAAGNGKVLTFSRSTLNAGLGNYIDIDHGNGIVSRYAHLQDVNVSWGQKIVKGQKIGTVGSSGGSAAPHLHFEILKNGKNVNPMIYMVEGLDAKAHDQLISKSKKLNQSLD
jgi:murein DD-endopeptidase MepM/ murein hydrolase activator NlpD